MFKILILAITFVFPIASLGQATTQVSGQKVTDNAMNPMTGNLVFTVTDGTNTPVTYTPSGGSPTTATISIPVVNGVVQYVGGFPPTIPNLTTLTPANSFYRIQGQNAGGSVTYYTLPLTNINTLTWSFDGYSAPPTSITAGVLTGLGRPQLACTPGAQYSNLSASDPYNWVCSQLKADGTIFWTQNPAVPPNVCQKPMMAYVSNRYGSPFCTDSLNAYATSNLVVGTSATGPFNIITPAAASVTASAIQTALQPLTNCNTAGGYAYSPFTGTCILSSGVTSFNTRTGTVMPAANDYSFSQLSGTAAPTQIPSATTTTQGGVILPSAAASNQLAPAASSTATTLPVVAYDASGNPTAATAAQVQSQFNSKVCQTAYFEGSSITRGLTLTGAQLAGGGLTGNYGNLVATSFWGGGITYYNDGVDSSTSTQMLARYTTGNSTYGVTVPSPHSVSPAVLGNGCKGWLFIDLTEIFNDVYIGSVPLATSLSNLQSELSQAHTDGWYVVMLTSPIVGTTVAGTAQINAMNQYVRNGTVPGDMVLDMAMFIPNQNDLIYYTTGGVHPNALGHQRMAANIIPALFAGGSLVNYEAAWWNAPGYFGAGLTIVGNEFVSTFLGIGTTNTVNPNALDVVTAGTTSLNAMSVEYAATGGYSSIQFKDSSGTARSAVGHGNSAVGTFTNQTYLSSVISGEPIVLGVNATERLRVTANGGVSIGTATFNATDPGAGNLAIQGTATIPSLIPSGSAPTITVGSAAGTGATASVTGFNMAGVISVTTGSATTASGILATVTFNGTLATAPMGCTVQARNAAAGLNASTFYTTAPSTTAWTISADTLVPAAATTMSWSYSCI